LYAVLLIVGREGHRIERTMRRAGRLKCQVGRMDENSPLLSGWICLCRNFKIDTFSEHNKQEQEEYRSQEDYQYLFPDVEMIGPLFLNFIFLFLEKISETMIGCVSHAHKGLTEFVKKRATTSELIWVFFLVMQEWQNLSAQLQGTI